MNAPHHLAGAVLLVAVCLSPTVAVEPREIASDAEALRRGDADGVAVTQRGQMFLAPAITPLGASGNGGPAHVWSAIADANGNLYLGTGPDGRIVKVDAGGRSTTLFTADEPMVTSLALLPGGDLLAGTAPEGRIYRIGPSGRGSVWAETGERYVWSLAVGADGQVWAGTGEDGVVYEINRTGGASPFFDTDESHVVELVALPDGSLLAGGAGRGLLYKIDPEAHGLVLHDDALPEVTGIAAAPDGSITLALLSPPQTEPRRPAVRIRLPQAAPAGSGAERVEIDEPDDGPTIEGVIEGLPRAAQAEPSGTRGRVVRIAPDGRVTEVWRSASEAPFAVALDERGRVLFGTGEPARLYRIESGDDVSLLATLREAQVTALAASAGRTSLATSNPAAAYRLRPEGPDSGVFLSDPIDAGANARWGLIEWRTDGEPGWVEFYTRTGNSAVPDATWSGWSPALTAPTGSPIVNPEGRYLQWRAKLYGRRGRDSRITSVRVSLATFNRPPEIADLRMTGGTRSLAERAEFRWRVRDADSDPLEVLLEFRSAGDAWSEAARTETAGEGWREGTSIWEAAAVPEGDYDVRAVATDRAANAPDEGRWRVADRILEVVVDRTAPRLAPRWLGDGSLEVVVTDDRAGVRRLEFVRGGRVRFTARPEDGVCDSKRETFRLPADQVTGDDWLLRARDAAGNTSEQPLTR